MKIFGFNIERKRPEVDLNKFRHALDTMEKAMRIDGKDYVIGGSLGLHLQGFPLDKPVRDIDMIMPDTPQINRKLKLMMNLYGDEMLFHRYFEHEPNYYAFKIHGMEYNIWVVPDFKQGIFTELGAVQSAYLIMKYKKKYGREKDKWYFDKLNKEINM